MKNPIEYLVERYDEIKAMRISSINNNNTNDLEKIEALEISYYKAVNILNESNLLSKRKTHIYDLETKCINDILDNCKIGINKKRINSTTFFAHKYNLTTQTVRNLIDRNN